MDGVILDMDVMVDVIVVVLNFLLFFLIVGVGNVDFSVMDFLDFDKKRFVIKYG